jgi:hypothetical protein
MINHLSLLDAQEDTMTSATDITKTTRSRVHRWYATWIGRGAVLCIGFGGLWHVVAHVLLAEMPFQHCEPLPRR